MHDELACVVFTFVLVNMILAVQALLGGQKARRRMDALQEQIVALGVKLDAVVKQGQANGTQEPASPLATPPTEPAAGEAGTYRPMQASSDLVPLTPLPEGQSHAAGAAHRRATMDTFLSRHVEGTGETTATPPTQPPTDTAFDKLRQRTQSLTHEQLLVRAFVLVGGLALALAGLYFVKYAYDQGLLNPTVRMSIGGAFGLALIALGQWLHHRSDRVAQSSVAAGVAVLFAVILGGRHVEHVFTSLTAFALMAGVTAAAVALSLRHGSFVAVLGLLGGFATPALVGSDQHSTASLFGYLLLLQLGLSTVIRHRQWWWMSILTMIGGLTWAGSWIFFNYWDGDSVWLGAFLLLNGGMAIWTAGDLRGEHDDENRLDARGFVGWAGGILCIALAAMLVPKAGYSWLEWSYFGLLGAGAMAVARLNERRIPLMYAATLASILLLAYWIADAASDKQQGMLLAVLIGGGVLHSLGPWACAFGSRVRGAWAWLGAVAAVLLTLLAFGEFHDDWSDRRWLAICLGLASLFVALTAPWLRSRSEHEGNEQVIAATTTACCFFLGMAIPMALDSHGLAVGWSLLAALIAFADLRLRIASLRVVCAAAALLAMLMVFPGILVVDPPIGDTPILNWFLYGLGVPTLAFTAAAFCLRQRGHVFTSELLAVLAAIAWLLLVTFEVRHFFHGAQWERGNHETLWEWGTYGIAWLTSGVGLLALSIRVKSPALRWTSITVLIIASLYCLIALAGHFNPRFRGYDVGTTPVLNVLLYTYGGPAAILLAIGYILRRRGLSTPGALATVAGVILLFTLINLEVRQAFQGARLDSREAISNAERYAYSVAWVSLSAVLLVTGIATRSLMVRWASLIIMLATIGKTFIDTKDLRDLYRVASFLGLGLALLGVGYLYHRFVFRRDAHLEPT